MTETVLATLYDKRSHFAGERALHLFDDRIEVTRNGRVETRLPLSTITQIRMSVEPAGGGVQVLCRARAGDQSLALGSLTSVGPRRWANNAPAFKAFVTALHRALASRGGEVEFVEGQPLALRLVVSAVGLAMTVGALFAGHHFFIVRENPVLGFVAGPFLLIGLALIWAFRPVRPAPYDPEALVRRMEGTPGGEPERAE
ncbi:MAG: hypothetical protein AAFX09_06140 [Pseudomonadota bacterium]